MAYPRTRKAVVFFGLILAGVTAAVWTVQSSRRSSGRAFAFRYTVSFPPVPANAGRVRMWIPLAKTRANQQVLSRQIRSSLPYEIHQDPIFGNDLLYLELVAPPTEAGTRSPATESREAGRRSPERAARGESEARGAPLDVVIDYDVRTSGETRSDPKAWWVDRESVASADEWSVSLRDEPLMVVNDTITQLATQASLGRRTDHDRARAIYDHVIGHMRYDKTTPGWGQGDTLRACQLGAGNCTDFHSLFISMSRAIGIPARFLIGATIPQEPSGTIPGYHCWAEFYRPGHGWVPVDASEAWKHPQLRDAYFGSWDANKFLISVGRNLTLAPAQEGPPVNYFVYPYVEVDSVPAGGVTTRFQFWDRKQQEGKT